MMTTKDSRPNGMPAESKILQIGSSLNSNVDGSIATNVQLFN